MNWFRRLPLVAALVALTLAGCSDSQPVSPVVPPPPAPPIVPPPPTPPFIPKSHWSGATYKNPRLRKPVVFVIDNAESLATFWNASFYSAPPAVPKIDFEADRIVVAAGGMMTGCPGAHLDSLKLDLNPIAVFAHTSSVEGPHCSPSCFYIYVSPWDAVLVPRFESPLEVHWSGSLRRCSPY